MIRRSAPAMRMQELITASGSTDDDGVDPDGKRVEQLGHHFAVGASRARRYVEGMIRTLDHMQCCQRAEIFNDRF